MTDKSQIAVDKFLSGYNCSQSVLFALNPLNEISDENLLKIATGFGAGMAREQEVCGAVTGAIMAIGLKYGRGLNDDKEVTEQTYEKVRILIDKFKEKHNTIVCGNLLGCNLTTAEGQKSFSENDLKNKTCVECVRTAARLGESLL